MKPFTGQHHRLVLRTILLRYPYLGVMIAGIVAFPAPVNRDVLLACCIFALLANALAHVYVRATAEHKWSGVLMAMADAGVALYAIRHTGMLASPFLIFFPVAMYSAHFLFLDRRSAIVFEAAGITGYVALAGYWSLSGGSVPGWSASSYPLFTAAIGVMDLLAIALYVFLAFDAGLLAGGLERQREALSAQEEKERLGHSLLAVAEELRNRLETVKANRSRGGELSGELPEDLRDEAAALDARCKDLETEMEDLLDGTIAYARDRMGTPVLAAVSVTC